MTQHDLRPLGVAMLGLGDYALHQLAPALLQTRHCRLTAIVTGTPQKKAEWQARFLLPDSHCYDYSNFDDIRFNSDVDIVYITLPNSQHREFAERAALAGKHVLCEKPMALTIEDCDRMITACNKAGVKLAIGYRLHYDPYHQRLMKLAADQTYGPIRKITAGFGFPITGSPDQWRLNQSLAGGGPVQDLGIYCVQAFCYLTGMEPVAVTAHEEPKAAIVHSGNVEQTVSFTLEFPGGLKTEARTSYAESINFLEVDAATGKFGLTNAFSFSGIGGYLPEGSFGYDLVSQQALQMDAFAEDIQEDRQVKVPGEMGRRDVAIIQAIYNSIQTGKTISRESGGW